MALEQQGGSGRLGVIVFAGGKISKVVGNVQDDYNFQKTSSISPKAD